MSYTGSDTLKWYTWRQNNSGGRFIEPAHFVSIQAPTHTAARRVAADIGVYFDGCSDGRDCPCCGDRWDDFPDVAEMPEVYGEPMRKVAEADWLDRSWLMVYADGRVERSAEGPRDAPSVSPPATVGGSHG